MINDHEKFHKYPLRSKDEIWKFVSGLIDLHLRSIVI